MKPTPCAALLRRVASPLARMLSPFALVPSLALAVPFTFSTGDPDGQMATASHLAGPPGIETETADDFVLGSQTQLNHATFTGLLTGGASASDIGQVAIRIYRVFPDDSDIGRTSGAPTYSTSQVPTRVNSPADVAFDSRDSALGTLTFSTMLLSAGFTAANSVISGIHSLPNQATGGEGPQTGSEVVFDVSFATPFDLAADHYFFVPLVGLTKGDFLWLSAPRPIVPPGTPFTPDLQSWIRDANLDPDWLRIGTDIVGGQPAPTFNAAFSLAGEAGAGASVPEPDSRMLLAIGGMALLAAGRRRMGLNRLAVRAEP